MPSISDLVDRIAHERWARFWTVVAGVVAVISLVVTVLFSVGRPGEGPQVSTPRSIPSHATTGSPSSIDVSPLTSPEPTSGVDPNALPTTSGSASTEVSYLADMRTVGGAQPAGTRSLYSGTETVDGTGYTHSLYALTCPSACGSPVCQYDLGRSWTGFHAVIGVSDDSDDSVVLQFEVYGDGRPITQARQVRLGRHIDLVANVVGVLRLKLVVTRVSGGGQATAVWGDASVSRS